MTVEVKNENIINDVPTVSIVLRIVLAFAIVAGCLFISAGTFKWPEAWAYISIQFSFSSALAFWLKRHNPKLLRERLRFTKRSAKAWDKAILNTGTFVFILYLIMPGLDAVRYNWSHIPDMIKYISFAGIIAGLGVIYLVMRENTYLSRFVEIQQGHKVITSGPYRYVRHPMYSAVIVYFFCFPLALGSLFGLIPSGLLIILIVIRTLLEDRMLCKELPGYMEYKEKTRFRLVPGIW